MGFQMRYISLANLKRKKSFWALECQEVVDILICKIVYLLNLKLKLKTFKKIHLLLTVAKLYNYGPYYYCIEELYESDRLLTSLA